jgi:vacuolar-type H+-ATPase catalytic subunit A/Vma1
MAKNEEILRELTRRVEQRRQEGRYPIGLEQQLASEFDAILSVVHRGDDTISKIHLTISQLAEDLAGQNSGIVTKSRVPGITIIHKIVRKLSLRHTQRALELVEETLSLVEKQLLQQRETDSRVMKQLEHVVMDRILMVDVLAEAVLELERKVGSGT